MYCSAAVAISGWNFGPIGGHDATWLLLNHAAAGTFTVTNNAFINGAAIYALQVSGTIAAPAMIWLRNSATVNLVATNNYVDGKWTDPCCSGQTVTPLPILGVGQSPVTVLPNAGGVNFITYNGTAALNAKYNAIFNMTGHAITYNGVLAASASMSDTVEFNYMEGWANRCANGHGEITYASGGTETSFTDGSYTTGTGAFSSASATFSAPDVGKSILVNGAGVAGANLYTTINTFVDSHNVTLTAITGPNVSGATYYYGTPFVLEDLEYNTILEPIAAGNCSATVLYPMGSVANNFFSNIIINGNTIVDYNFVGGAPAMHNQLAGVIDDGNGTFFGNAYTSDCVAGNVFTIQATGTYGNSSPGAYVGAQYQTWKRVITAPKAGAYSQGVGSQWLTECANIAAPYCNATSFAPTAQAISTTSNGVGAGLCSAAGTVGATQPDWQAVPTYNQGSTFNHGVVAAQSITNNYVNWYNDTFSASTNVWQANGATACGVPFANSVSGNIDMMTGASLNSATIISSPGC
jgi:hypothetical protein